MQDWSVLLIAFILGFFMKHLLGTVCNKKLLIEGVDDSDPCTGCCARYPDGPYAQWDVPHCRGLNDNINNNSYPRNSSPEHYCTDGVDKRCKWVPYQ